MPLEKRLGMDYITEEAKAILNKRWDQRFNRTIHDVLTTIIQCSVEGTEKEKDYEIALALCTYYGYPINAIQTHNPSFEDYCQKTTMPMREAMKKVREFLRV
jgi:hypothetical protein